MSIIKNPKIGKTCPVMIKENYDYHLSGDAAKFCVCSLNNKPCLGVVVSDPDEQSSQFFSRGKCMIDTERIKRCPVYGATKEIFELIIKNQIAKELEIKLQNLKDA